MFLPAYVLLQGLGFVVVKLDVLRLAFHPIQFFGQALQKKNEEFLRVLLTIASESPSFPRNSVLHVPRHDRA